MINLKHDNALCFILEAILGYMLLSKLEKNYRLIAAAADYSELEYIKRKTFHHILLTMFILLFIYCSFSKLCVYLCSSNTQHFELSRFTEHEKNEKS